MLEVRVAALERRCRILTGILIAMIAAFGFVAASGKNANYDVVRAKKLFIEDEKERNRIVLSVDPKTEMASFLMIGASTKPSGLIAQCGKDGTLVQITDSNSKSRVKFGTEEGKGSVIVADSKDNIRIGLATLDDGTAAVVLFDGAGKVAEQFSSK